MATARLFRRRWTTWAAQATRIASAIPVALTFLLAGCTTGNFLLPAAPNDWVERGPESADVASTPSAELAVAGFCLSCPPAAPPPTAAEPSKPSAAPPRPRTLPQAFCAYLRCLRYGPPPSEEQATNGSTKEEPSKNPTTENGSSEKGANGKEKGDGKKEPSKSPAAEKEAPENEAGGKEKDKANGNGKGEENGNGKGGDKEKDQEDWYSAHAQATVITQTHDRFRSPYVAFNSLPPVEPYVTSETTTVFLATRLWEGGELIFNPEVAGGRGFGAVVSGIANYPNAEITRVGVPEPTPYIARLLFRQTFGFGGEREKVEDALNQIAGSRDVSRLTVSIGKMGATDVADDNRYSHDPRTQFLPWAMVFDGAWDYPANVRGYTYGVAFDRNEKDWALRYGIFAVARFANSAQFDPNIVKANGQILELERRYTLNDHPGKLRLWSFLNLAHMGKYSEAVARMPVNPDITLTRAYRIKYGFGGNVEQELTKDLGAFARFGWNDGHTESWMFTEIDATVALGLLLKGRCWCRPQDTLGVAVAANGLSREHRDYLAAGGLGFIIGDGRLNYGLEKTAEGFYNFEVRKGISFALDLQGIDHPAYNKDRGPVFVASGRLHIEF